MTFRGLPKKSWVLGALLFCSERIQTRLPPEVYDNTVTPGLDVSYETLLRYHHWNAKAHLLLELTPAFTFPTSDLVFTPLLQPLSFHLLKTPNTENNIYLNYLHYINNKRLTDVPFQQYSASRHLKNSEYPEANLSLPPAPTFYFCNTRSSHPLLSLTQDFNTVPSHYGRN